MVKLNCDIYLRRKGYFTFSRTTTALVHFVINNPKTFLFKCKICCSISCEPMGGKTPFHFSLVQIRENNCNIYTYLQSTYMDGSWPHGSWGINVRFQKIPNVNSLYWLLVFKSKRISRRHLLHQLQLLLSPPPRTYYLLTPL